MELPYVRAELRVWCLQMTMTIVVPQIATMVALLASVLSEPSLPLTAELAFPILSLFSVIRFPLMYLGEEAGQLAQASIALRRLRGFLMEPAAAVPSPPPCVIAPSDVTLAKPSMVPAAPLLVVAVAEPEARAAAAVEVSQLSVWWKGPSEQDPSAEATAGASVSASADAEAVPGVTALRDASLCVCEGELLLVAGGVASGKSSLLAGLLGEARTHCHGVPRLPAEGIAFCAQVPWVQNMSLRDNVVFGRPWDAARFLTVLEACSLRQDLAALPHADHTIIGERGVTLSGGQKQRVALARAAYGLPRLLLLDDVFSALDGPTGRHIFSALFGDAGLLRASAVVLVSHATHFAPSATSILLLHQGDVVASGSLEQLHALAVRPKRLPMEVDKRAALTGFLSSVGGGAGAGAGAGGRSVDPSMDAEEEAMAEAEDAALLAPKQLILTDAPDHVRGSADLTRPGWHSLRLWLRAAGGCSWLLPELLFFVCERASYVGADVWLSAWTAAGARETQTSRTLATVIGLGPVTSARAQSPYLGIYAGFVLANCIFAYTRTTWFAKGGAVAAARVFEYLLHAVVRSPVVFFDTTPVGRLVARLSYDTEIVDAALVQKGLTVLASLFWLLSGLSVILGVVPPVAAAIGLCAPVFALTHAAYQRSGVQLQRLYAEAQAPLVSHIEESLAGGATIRAHGCQRRFAHRLSQLNDDASAAYVGFAAVGRWLAFRLETIGAFISFAVATACWAMRDQMSAPLSGLAIVWSFNLTVTLNFIVLSTSDLESKGVSLERILEYAALPPEASLRADADDALAPDWPARGAVDFVNVSLRYQPGLPLALNGLTCSIGAGEHAGIVGRTGAGKSTIAAALFRLVELESGTVRIDGVDLRTLGLHAVRGRALAIIPQEPVLFRGAVRRSLDPLAQHSDEALWAALETVDMARTVRGLEGELSAESDESGSNFSVGERQLLCFARAMLRAPRLLVLDEATASVDHLADERIQRAIRGAMRSTTLLTVAHRLHTVMDYDRILVLSDGKCAEIGVPHALLQEPASSLSQLVDLIGGEVGLKLRDIARRSATTARAKQE